MLVDFDAPAMVFNASGFQIKAFHIGDSPGRYHDFVNDQFMLVITMLDRAAKPPIARFDFLKLRAEANVDAFFFENVKDNFAGGRIILVHDLIATLQNGDL